MKLYDRIRVRETEVTGMIIHLESKREHTAEKILFVTVCLDDGNIMVYDVSEVKLV